MTILTYFHGTFRLVRDMVVDKIITYLYMFKLMNVFNGMHACVCVCVCVCVYLAGLCYRMIDPLKEAGE